MTSRVVPLREGAPKQLEELEEAFARGVDDEAAESAGKSFSGKLKKNGQVELPGVYTKEIKYTKRDRKTYEALRAKFDSSIRAQFARSLGKDADLIAVLKKAGLSDIDIAMLKKGNIPDGYQVHHKLPLDDGGDNSFSNLVLIKNDPYHKVITSTAKNKIAAKRKEFGGSLQPPCSTKDVAELQARARKELGVEVPSGYVEFLRQHDGLNWNGLFIHASKTVPIVGYKDRFIEGFVDWNLGFRSADWKNKFVVFGDSGMDLYVFEPSMKKYSARDRVSLDEVESYSSFEEMISAALRKHL